MSVTCTLPRTCTNGDEIDAFDHADVFTWRAGQRARIKRTARRRERHTARAALRDPRTW